MVGRIGGITVDLVAADGSRLPAFISANVRRDADGKPDLIRLTAQDASDRRSYEQELLSERRRAEDAQTRAEVLATTLRRSLLPPSLSPPAGLQAAAYYHAASASEVSGDFYDLFPLTRTRSAFFLGDVCGKDAEAAALTSLTRYTLRASAVNDDAPDGGAAQPRHDAAPRARRLRPATVLHRHIRCHREVRQRLEGASDSECFDIELASGGHPPALLLSADGQARYVAHARRAGRRHVPLTAVRHRASPPDPGRHPAAVHRRADRGADQRRPGALRRRRCPAALRPRARACHGGRDHRQRSSRLLGDIGAGMDDDTALLALGVPQAG